MNTALWIAGPLIGLVGMMSGGFWGVGCGWIVVPSLLILGFDPLSAVGIGLLQMVPSTIPTVSRQLPEIGWKKAQPGRLTCASGNTTGDKGEVLPAGKTTADFINSILPKDAAAPAAPPTLPAPVIAGSTFTKVYPGSTVRFTVTAENKIVQPTQLPQVFRAKIKVLAGGCTDLDEREVIILVPPTAPPVVG